MHDDARAHAVEEEEEVSYTGAVPHLEQPVY
jgi:hypothetical protein